MIAAKLLAGMNYDLSINIINIGARPISSEREPFEAVLDFFPKSLLINVEIDSELCNEMNTALPHNIRYISSAIGKSSEQRYLFQTIHPMCTSLYPPNEKYADYYQYLDVMRLKEKSGIRTVSLDDCLYQNRIDFLDFIKIDIQGAELDVFKGGLKTLENVLCVVSEVEFVPLYKDQPLFGDVCSFLDSAGIMFHKFLNFGGRALKPFVYNNDPNIMSQFMWSDALFIRDIFKIEMLTDDQLLKLAILADIYGSLDVTFFLLNAFDQRKKTQLAKAFLDALNAVLKPIEPTGAHVSNQAHFRGWFRRLFGIS